MTIAHLRSHLVIPDTQDREGVPKHHLSWIGQYIVDRQPDVVVHLGDHWDMPSLSGFDKPGSHAMEGRRYALDVAAGNEGIELLRAPARRAEIRTEFHLLTGNHEQRIETALENDPKLIGAIGLGDLKAPGWTRHGFLEPVWLDGVCYSHYFYQPMTGRPFTGTVENRLRQLGHSFSMGHQQTLLYGIRYVAGRSQHGLVAGSAYCHDEDYKGPQGNAHWRGVVVKHEVDRGSYNPMFVSFEWLCRNYEGCSFAHLRRKVLRVSRFRAEA